MTDVNSPRSASDLRSYLTREIAVSVVINLAFAAFFTTLIFSGGNFKLWGPGGLALDFLPATFIPVFGMTAGITWISRKRLRAGALRALVDEPIPLPKNIFLRGLLFGVAATIVLGLLGLGALMLIWSPQLTFKGLLSFKLIYGAAIGVFVTPLIILAVLRERA